MNPFKNMEDDQLYNISTGRSTTDTVADFLLNVEKIGNAKGEQFITECSMSNTRFEEAIKQNKILNFASSNEKKKVNVNNKVQEVRLQRDLFGRMLGISMSDNNVDIEKALTSPITPVPMSSCHLDGTICKTEKSALLKCLKLTSSVP